jgi:phosphatidylserine/phosphatidylglycerophosphate/cardiolipin synthase-like enzyme
MSNSTSNFTVNGVSLDRGRFSAATFRQMNEFAQQLPVEKTFQKDWDQIADSVAEHGGLNKEEFESLRSLARTARKERSQLRKEFAATQYQDKEIGARLVPFNAFESRVSKLTEAYRVSSAQTAVGALAGGSFGATGVVTAYHAYANLPKAGLKNLVGSLQDTSKLEFPGNKVEQVHQEKLWQAMNTMLDEGVRSAEQGKPVEINAQYYELTSQTMLGKMRENAQAGNKIRINVDPGRLVPFKGTTLNIDDIPDKLRTMLQVADMPGDVAISTYPVKKELGSASDLMHRKGLRVGDKFLLSGMNANAGSGENVDAGYIIEGPAARKLVENFSRDVQASKDSTLEEIYSKDALDKFPDRDVRMGQRGLSRLFDTLSGPSDAGSNPPRFETYEQLKKYAALGGHDLAKFIDLPPEEQGSQLDPMIKSGAPLPLSDFGKEKVLEVIQRVNDKVRSPENQRRLADITPPSAEAKGTTAVSLADTPTDRETLLLKQINDAEKFIYVPAFVITRPVAAALVAKRDAMKQEGKDMDIRVLADPGVYPDGSTPNEWGAKFLEDHDVPVRWAVLPRTGGHDRKVHAKELLTDKGDFVGSTNFSSKGLRDNWEHSGTVHFDPADPAAAALRDEAKSSFDDLWDNYSLEMNSKEQAASWKRSYRGADKDAQIDMARNSAIRGAIRSIEAYEKESGTWINAQIGERKLDDAVQKLMNQGMDDGNAKLQVLEQSLGREQFLAGLHALPGYQRLLQKAT